jgi:hypothetical protein
MDFPFVSKVPSYQSTQITLPSSTTVVKDGTPLLVSACLVARTCERSRAAASPGSRMCSGRAGLRNPILKLGTS